MKTNYPWYKDLIEWCTECRQSGDTYRIIDGATRVLITVDTPGVFDAEVTTRISDSFGSHDVTRSYCGAFSTLSGEMDWEWGDEHFIKEAEH